MKLRKAELLSLGIAAAAFLIGWHAYPRLPEQVASHWNAHGEVNGHLGRFWGAFLPPTVLLGILLILILVPRLDPQRANIEKFRARFDRFIVLVCLFMLYVYGLTLAWNLGHVFNLARFLSPAFAALLYGLGGLLAYAEPNWTIGVRTPWTLSNPVVWERTNRLAGKFFKISGLLALGGLFFPNGFVWFTLAPVAASSLGAVAYSYLEFRKIEKARQPR